MAAFDPIAFAMGKAGASRDLVSALMGGNGGGGGSGTLEESGWLYRTNEKATVSGNVITFATGSVSTYMSIAPPEDIGGQWRNFQSGDIVELAINIIELSHRVNVSMAQSSGTFESTTGVFSIPASPTAYFEKSTETTGKDIVIARFKSTGKIQFAPRNLSGQSDRTASALFEITGMRYNGTVIFGKV